MRVKQQMRRWLRLGALLCFIVFQCSQAMAQAGGIVTSTVNIEKDNYNRLKESALDLSKSFKAFGDSLTSMGKDLSSVCSDAGKSVEEVQNLISQLQGASVESLKNMKFDSLKTVFSDISSKLDGSAEGVDDIKRMLGELQTKTDMVINNAKAMLTLTYTMPVGIRSSGMRFELSVDTLRYARMSKDSGSVAMDVHATWVLPWTISDGVDANVISFRGENVVLKGSGSSKIKIDDGTSSSKLLYQSYTLAKDKIYLDLDTTTYVEIDCNGFKQMYLSGRVRFSSSIITAAEPVSAAKKTSGTISDSLKAIQDSLAKVVTASFKINVTDLNDIVFEAQLDQPFKIKVTDDIVYTAHGLVADFSTMRNGEYFAFPKGYISPFAAGDENYWTGFAIKTLKVDLTREFPDFPLQSVAAYNMLIDETGVSGWFEAKAEFGKVDTTAAKNANATASNNAESVSGNAQTAVAPASKKGSLFGENSTVQATFKSISLGLSCGKVSGGGLDGTIIIKPLQDDNGKPLTLGLNAQFYTDSLKGLSFVIESKLEKDMKRTLPVLKTTTILIGAGTSVTYSKTLDTTGQYQKAFVLNLNGGLDMDNKVLKVDGLRFEGLKFSSANPHFYAGNFSLNSIGSPNIHGLDFGLKNIKAQSSENEALLHTDMYLEIIGKESSDDKKQGVSVDGSFQVVSDIDNKWKINGLRLRGIDVDVSYSAFRLRGAIKAFDKETDNVFGDGFAGNLAFSMKTPPIAVDVEAKFGKTNYINGTDTTAKPYRYWFAYASADFPGTPIFPPAVLMNSASLALYSRMGVKFDMNQFKLQPTVPNKAVAFGFEAGIGVCVAQDNLINAKAKLGLEFSSSGGIGKVSLAGKVAVVSKEPDDGLLTGSVYSAYDFKNEILMFDASVTPGERVKKIVQGTVGLKLRTYPESWYCNIGTYNNPCKLTFAEKINTETYMMFGDSVPSVLPPLDPKISAMFNVTQSTATSADHSDEMSNGTGFAFGAALSVECHLNKFVYADVAFKGGTDLLVVRKPGFICENSKYRASGRVFVYLDVSAGIKARRKKFEVVEFEAAANLEGELPKPFFVHGEVGFRYRLLGGLLKGNATAKFEAGTKCTWTANGEVIHENVAPSFFDEVEHEAPDENGEGTSPDSKN